ncbi:hypothetical protein GCM10020229_56310 [Kitasatospora albolonga]
MRRVLRVCLAGVLVAAVLAAVPRAGTGRGLPVQLLAAEPAPGRIVYAADQSHRALVLAAGSEAPTTALLPPGSAGGGLPALGARGRPGLGE